MQNWTDPGRSLDSLSPDLCMQLSLIPLGSPESSGNAEFPQVPSLNRKSLEWRTNGESHLLPRNHWPCDLQRQPSPGPV